MSVELTRPQQGARTVTGTDLPGKKAGKSGSAGADVGNGFAALMSSLGAEEVNPVELSAEPPKAGQEAVETMGLMAIPDGVLVAAAPALAPALAPSGLPLLAAPDGAMRAAAGPATPLAAGDLAQGGVLQRPVTPAGKSAALSALEALAPQKLTDATPSIVTAEHANASGGRSLETGAPLPLNAWLAHRNSLQVQTLNGAQQASKNLKEAAMPSLTVNASDAAMALTMGEGGTPVRVMSRFGTGSSAGSAGLEGFFGGAAAAASRSESVFEVPPTSSVVADTAVAETVSYWASQGVQTAELTLDGFGDSPVEVSIVLNGDQTQIDFRSDQTVVRQVIESATAQLKEMLVNQGLQLTGMSVGSFGKGTSHGEERRQRGGVQQVKLVKSDLVSAPAGRAANAAVGQSLDLFV